MRTPLRSFLATAIVVFCFGIAVAVLSALLRGAPHGGRADPGGAEPGIPASARSGEQSPSGDLDLVRELVDAGWDASAATAVVDINSEFFGIQREENPQGFARQMILLRGLGKRPRLSGFLIQHPEMAGLLVTVDDPEPIAESLENSPADYDLLASCYAYHVAPDDAKSLAEALTSNCEAIIRLTRRGQIGAEAVFVFDRKALNTEAYESWLRDVLDSKLGSADEDLSSFLNFTMRGGPEIRRRMQSDPTFASRFRAELWPRLVRALPPNRGGFEHVADEPRVWDLLSLDQGEALTRDCGLLAIDLLYGYPEVSGYPNPYPRELHPKIVQLLLQRDGTTVKGLYDYRNEPNFAHLLSRNLSSETVQAAICRLREAAPAHPALLSDYARMTNDGLVKAVGPPSHSPLEWLPLYYTFYEVPRKIMQGRDPSTMDWFQALVDPVFLVVDLASAGESKVLRGSLTEAGKTVVEAGLENGGRKLWVTTLSKEGQALAAREIGKDVAEKLGEKELAQWTLTRALTETRRVIGSAVIKSTTFEVTKPLQLMFKYSGIGRETLKRITGLEARLFMRGDSRVFIQFTHLAGAVVGSRTAAFFERAGKDLVLGTLAESEPGQRAARIVVEAGISAKEQLFRWKQQISAWYLLNASMVQ